MSDLLEDVPAPFKLTVGGVDVFPGELNIYELAALVRSHRAEARARRLQNCRDAGLDGDRTYVELEAFDGLRYGTSELADIVDSIEGQESILAAAFAKAYPDAGGALLARVHWRSNDRLRAAAHMVGLSVETRPAEDDDGDDDGYGGRDNQGSGGNPTTGHRPAPTTETAGTGTRKSA